VCVCVCVCVSARTCAFVCTFVCVVCHRISVLLAVTECGDLLDVLDFDDVLVAMLDVPISCMISDIT
jgi:hypothetical protein